MSSLSPMITPGFVQRSRSGTTLAEAGVELEGAKITSMALLKLLML